MGWTAMKGTVICLDQLGGRLAAARLVDGVLDDLLIAPPDGMILPGSIYRARSGRQMKGQGGAMLDLGGDGAGYLRQAKGVQPGDVLTVQVTGFADGDKAAPVTDRLLLKSRYAIATPDAAGYNISRKLRDDDRREALLALMHDVAGAPGAVGLILRSACEGADDAAIAEDILAMLDLAGKITEEASNDPQLLFDGPDPHTMAWRDWPEPDLLAVEAEPFLTHGMHDMVAALRHPDVDLSGGGRMAVEPTRALVAVDVNTGGDTSPAAGLKANIAAARALPAQLRCRGLGGQISVDFAPMPKKDRRQLEQILRAAFRADPVQTVLAGWTPLGCFELQRKRDRLPLDLPPGES